MHKLSVTAILAVAAAGFCNVGAISAYASSPPAGGGITTTTTTPAPPSTTSSPQSVPPPPMPLPRPRFRAPLPPDTPGCYLYRRGGAWQREDCDTPEYIQQHIPHPETFEGPFEDSTFRSPFVASTVQVTLKGVGGGEKDTQFGDNSFSIQDNVFFTGNNGLPDAVQFTNQAQPDGNVEAWSSQVFTDNVCVWQILDVEVNGAVPSGNYNSTCYSVDTRYTGLVQGFTRDNGTLEAGVPYDGGVIAVIASDTYGLETGDRWDNSTGSILGYGNGSEAVFGGRAEAHTTVDGTTCLNGDEFWIETFPIACTPADYISGSWDPSPGPGQAFTGVSPNLTGFGTEESNNLVPVNAPALTGEWYHNKYNAEMAYTATATGHCWTGSSPFCGM
ncbi:MAG TPA: hypothetical protein VEJ84_12835 [Acidimicrobiales bacterium]|nr:hypothetical protein [Acidimicrobiales bacterium]